MSKCRGVSFESIYPNKGDDSFVIEYRKSRSSQWEQILAEQMEQYMKQSRKSSTLGCDPDKLVCSKKFPTGSQYDGEWTVLGMNGQGKYTFPHGVVYEGGFSDGHFHGSGELLYPNGMSVKGTWDKDVLVTKEIIFPDGLHYAEKDWEYCTFPDRRFNEEVNQGLQPAGESFLTNQKPSRKIPQGCFDTGDGFYDPERKVVFDYEDFEHIFRAPTAEECVWIERNCRKSTDEPSGEQTDLYEVWLEPKVGDFKQFEDGASTPIGHISDQREDETESRDQRCSIYKDVADSLDRLHLEHWPRSYSRCDFERVFNNPLDEL